MNAPKDHAPSIEEDGLMQLLTRLAGMLACLGAALLPVAAHVEEVIAHRGVFLP